MTTIKACQVCEKGDCHTCPETAPQPYPDPRIKRDYVCAICWAHLFEQRDDDGILQLACSAYGFEHEGFHRKTTVERIRSNDQADAIEAKQLLRKVGVIDNPHKGKTAEDILSELGF